MVHREKLNFHVKFVFHWHYFMIFVSASFVLSILQIKCLLYLLWFTWLYQDSPLITAKQSVFSEDCTQPCLRRGMWDVQLPFVPGVGVVAIIL